MWDPFRDLDRFLGGLNNTLGNAGGPYALLGRNRWNVSANVVEDNTHYIVEADVPGLQKEDVRVRVEDGENRVCISGNRARPAYYQQLLDAQRQRFGGGGGNNGNEGGSYADSFAESTVTTIDENGQVVSTTTTTNHGALGSEEEEPKKRGRKHRSIFGNNDTSAPAAEDPNPKRALLIEKDFGEFERCFTFPQRIVRDTTTAELEGGVLTLTVEKAYPRNGKGNVDVTVRGK